MAYYQSRPMYQGNQEDIYRVLDNYTQSPGKNYSRKSVGQIIRETQREMGRTSW